MIVTQIYADNPLRNFHYLIACPETKEAMVIDPLDVDRCLNAAQKSGFKITKILNTHEHYDHIGGNAEMQEKTGAEIFAHAGAKGKIDNIAKGLKAGDTLKIGTQISFKVLDTPGHTDSHICIISEGSSPALFCGDTLFNAGAGNCHNGGNMDDLFDTFSQQLCALPEDTLIYPGHDYMLNNLEFSLNREPDNKTVKEYLLKLEKQDPHQAHITSLRQEKQINSFFRLQKETIIAGLKEKFPELGNDPSQRNIFKALRILRNNW
jgi:hydroxyacylglutathione hydrolase